MKTELSIQVRAFPVVVEDQRTGEQTGDTIVLTKEQLSGRPARGPVLQRADLQAVQPSGLQSA